MLLHVRWRTYTVHS